MVSRGPRSLASVSDIAHDPLADRCGGIYRGAAACVRVNQAACWKPVTLVEAQCPLPTLVGSYNDRMKHYVVIRAGELDAVTDAKLAARLHKGAPIPGVDLLRQQHLDAAAGGGFFSSHRDKVRDPNNTQGITRESFSTSTFSARRCSGRWANTSSATSAPSFAIHRSIRAALRSASGSCAINSSGKAKSKSEPSTHQFYAATQHCWRSDVPPGHEAVQAWPRRRVAPALLPLLIPAGHRGRPAMTEPAKTASGWWYVVPRAQHPPRAAAADKNCSLAAVSTAPAS